MKSRLTICVFFAAVTCITAVALATAPRFEIAGTEAQSAVVDHATTLMWQQQSTLDAPVTWAAALAHCEGLVYAGFEDWRLPAINELLSLVDEKKTELPAVNTTFFVNFPATPNPGFWTSTTHRRQASQAYVVYFGEPNTVVGRGGTTGQNKAFEGNVLCVRDL